MTRDARPLDRLPVQSCCWSADFVEDRRPSDRIVRHHVVRRDLGQMTNPAASFLSSQTCAFLRQIKVRAVVACDICAGSSTEVHPRESAMPVNVGTIDQYVRIVVGLALIAYALQDGLSIQGWHWIGFIGLVPLATAFFKSCPIYTVLGISSCTVRQ
jgi:hypothetical protein